MKTHLPPACHMAHFLPSHNNKPHIKYGTYLWGQHFDAAIHGARGLAVTISQHWRPTERQKSTEKCRREGGRGFRRVGPASAAIGPPPHLPLRVDGLRQVRGGGDAGPERRVHHARTSLRVPARGKRSLVLGGKGLGLAEKRPPAGSPSSPGARPNLDLDQTHVRTVCFFLKKPQYRRIRKWKSSGLEAPTADLKKRSTRASFLAHITSQGKVSITLRRTGRDDRN